MKAVTRNAPRVTGSRGAEGGTEIAYPESRPLVRYQRPRD